MGVIIGGEPMTIKMMIGMAMTIGGIIVLTTN
jgi:multidrug transporter EmrE-like cation transporter